MSAGKKANPGDLASAGFGPGGVTKGSVGATMQSHADKTDHGKSLVSEFQSKGAKQQHFTGSGVTRGDLDSAGFRSGGVAKDSLGSRTMSKVDKSGTGAGLKSSAQSIGAKK